MSLWQWILSGAGVGAAFGALLWARHVTRRLDRISQSYWELRYEYGQLSARVSRLESAGDLTAGDEEPGPRVAAKTSFVPLASLRK